MNHKETMQAKRDEYMAGKITHQAYYEWLSEFIGLGYGLIPFTAEQVAASKDPHLNDLPLASWDRMHDAVRRHAGGLFWSLCDTVCCLKALARKRQAGGNSRRLVKVTWSNGDTTETEINGTEQEIRAYYLGNDFNIGDGAGGDNMQRATSVEFLA